MARHLPGEAAHAIPVGAGVQAARPYIGPTEATHEAREPYRLAGPMPHGDFQFVEHVGRGDALDAVVADAPLELAQRALPGVLLFRFAGYVSNRPKLLQERTRGYWMARFFGRHQENSVPLL